MAPSPPDGRAFARQTLFMAGKTVEPLSTMWCDAVEYVKWAEVTGVLVPAELLDDIKDFRDALADTFRIAGYVMGGCRDYFDKGAEPAPRGPAPTAPVEVDEYDDDDDDDQVEDDNAPIDPERFTS